MNKNIKTYKKALNMARSYFKAEEPRTIQFIIEDGRDAKRIDMDAMREIWLVTTNRTILKVMPVNLLFEEYCEWVQKNYKTFFKA
jgi:hypothetical protein